MDKVYRSYGENDQRADRAFLVGVNWGVTKERARLKEILSDFLDPDTMTEVFDE